MWLVQFEYTDARFAFILCVPTGGFQVSWGQLACCADFRRVRSRAPMRTVLPEGAAGGDPCLGTGSLGVGEGAPEVGHIGVVPQSLASLQFPECVVPFATVSFRVPLGLAYGRTKAECWSPSWSWGWGGARTWRIRRGCVLRTS
jgi:hypothetical protein